MKYEYWFANIKGISGKKKREIREKVTDASELFCMQDKEWSALGASVSEIEKIKCSKKKWDVERQFETFRAKDVQMITVCDKEYPERLLKLQEQPYALYVKGQLPSEQRITVGIVGARECSAYGYAMAKEYGKALGQAGVEVISGMARGVDSTAQKGALDGNGFSYGVLGCGVDVCYPREEMELYLKLQERGGILSEFALGEKPLRQHFPARNRIISGLSDILLVLEAKEKSGSLITVDYALEQGKDIYALPGPVNSTLSRGCNQLIKQGAGVLLSPEELLEEIGIVQKSAKENGEYKKILLESQENMVYSCLDFKPRNLGEILRQTNLPVNELLDLLVNLELRGLVKEISKNYYIKVGG